MRLIFSAEYFRKQVYIYALHLYVQVDYVYTYVHVPGQQCILQRTVVTFSPWQSLPPQLGLGWAQLRHLVITPPSQDLEHSVIVYHGVHPPSTENDEIFMYIYCKQ